jgi:acetyl esterase/lipase
MMAPVPDGYEVTRDIPYAEGPRRRLDVYQPRGAPAPGGQSGGGPRPVILYLYGGLWTNGAKDDPSSFALPQALVERGAVVVVPDYRLYPDTAWPGFMEDAAAALAWTRREAASLGGDPRGVFISGHSSGAHMALLLGLDPRWLAAAEGRRPGAPPAPPLAGVIGLSGVYEPGVFELPFVRPIFVAAPPDRAPLLPARFLRPGAPPLLLVAGGWDWIVDPGNTTRLAAAARQAGVGAESRVYPRYGHFDILTAGPWLPSLSPAADDIASFVRRRMAEVVPGA